MADFLVGSVTFKDPSGAVAGGVSVADRYWFASPVVSERTYDRRKIARPGEPGFHVKKFGSRGKTITAEVFYVAANLGGVYSAQNGDRAAMENSLFNVTAPGRGALTNVQLETFPEGLCFPLPDGKVFMKTVITLFETN